MERKNRLKESLLLLGQLFLDDYEEGDFPIDECSTGEEMDHYAAYCYHELQSLGLELSLDKIKHILEQIGVDISYKPILSVIENIISFNLKNLKMDF